MLCVLSRNFLVWIALAIALFCLLTAPVQAWPGSPNSIVTTFQQGFGGYAGTVDTYLSNIAPDTAFNNNPDLRVFASQTPPPVQGQTLLRFDDIFGSGVGQVPLGADILSATLSLRAWGEDGGNPPYANGYRMLVPWQGTDTFNSLGDGVQVNGIEASATPDFVDLGKGANPIDLAGHLFTFDVLSAVQAWQSNPAMNFGWVLDGGGSAVDIGIHSSKFSILGLSMELRPALTVEYAVESNFAVVPPGLKPGDQYRLAFVTDTQRNALSPWVADYNALVTEVAESVPELAALDTTWRAIVSGLNGVQELVNAASNADLPIFGGGLPVYRLDGVMVSDGSEFWGPHDAPINVDEHGKFLPPGQLVWTGTSSFGVGSDLMGSEENTTVGDPSQSGSPAWVDIDYRSNNELHHFYAISGVLTVPAVPEPSTMVLGCMAAVGFVVGSLRRRRSSRFSTARSTSA